MTKKPLIMIVDDIYDNIEILLTVLKVRGYDLVYATSGEEALEKLVTCKPDLILLDVLMPEMDGFETCDAIKDIPSLTDIPIIFLTGVQNQDYILKGFEYGAVDYITKPFNTLELISRVKNHIDLKISKDKLIEYQAELTKHIADKNKFFSIIAEDLKTNFSSFMGFVEILATQFKTMTDIDQELILKNVLDMGSDLNNVLYHLFIWAQLQTNSLPIQIRKFSVSDIVKDCIFKVSELCHNRGIKIKSDLAESINSDFDYNTISIALDNVIDNAIKYSEDNADILISSSKLTDEKNVQITVSDNGPGISDQALANIFSMTKRKSNTMDNDKSGLGLGLILSKELIEKNKGKIQINSELGKGTYVKIILPIHNEGE